LAQAVVAQAASGCRLRFFPRPPHSSSLPRQGRLVRPPPPLPPRTMPMLTRRSRLARPLAAGLALAAVSTILRAWQAAELVALVPSTRALRAAPAPLAGVTAAGGSRRGGVPVRFWDRIQEALGMSKGKDPEQVAANALKELTGPARAKAKMEQKDLKEKRTASRAAMVAVSSAMKELREAQESAMQACEVGWDEDETKWDASLSECAAPVLEKAKVAESALDELGATGAALQIACDAMEAAVKNRTSIAEAVVAELQPEAKEKLASAVKEASQPISDGAALRSWVLAKADVVDMRREIKESMTAKVDAEALIDTLRERRAARNKAEIAAAKAKAAEEALAAEKKAKAKAAAAAASAAPTPASSSEEGPSPLLLVAAAVAAGVAVYFSGGLGGGRVSFSTATKVAQSNAVATRLQSVGQLSDAVISSPKGDLEVKAGGKGELLSLIEVEE